MATRALRPGAYQEAGAHDTAILASIRVNRTLAKGFIVSSAYYIRHVLVSRFESSFEAVWSVLSVDVDAKLVDAKLKQRSPPLPEDNGSKYYHDSEFKDRPADLVTQQEKDEA